VWLLELCRARGLKSGGVAKVHTQRCFACATRIEQLEEKAVTQPKRRDVASTRDAQLRSGVRSQTKSTMKSHCCCEYSCYLRSSQSRWKADHEIRNSGVFSALDICFRPRKMVCRPRPTPMHRRVLSLQFGFRFSSAAES
jgi:hypothetical protein